MKNKKLLIVSPFFPPHIGGAQNYAFNIALGLKKEFGWDVVVVTSNHINNKRKVEKIKGIKVYRLPMWFKISSTPINPFWYFDIKKIIRDEKPDLINAHSPVPFISDITALAKNNLPFVLTYHAGSMKKGKFIADLGIHIYENLLLPNVFKKSIKVICSSMFVKDSMLNNFSKKAFVVYPAVDISIFKPNKNKKNKKTILFVGRKENYYMKGLFHLIDAVKDLKDVKLNVIGEKIPLKQKNVKFLGNKDMKGLVAEMQNASVLVLPPLAKMEAFGMVLVEAMACKTPVIGTNMGGIPEVIENGVDGIIVRPNSPDALREAILKIINSDKTLEKMGEAGYKKVHSKFLWKYQVSQTNNIFNKALYKNEAGNKESMKNEIVN